MHPLRREKTALLNKLGCKTNRKRQKRCFRRKSDSVCESGNEILQKKMAEVAYRMSTGLGNSIRARARRAISMAC